MPGKLYIFGHSSDAFHVYGAYVGIVQEPNQNMPLQLPAESKWCIPGSACHITLLQGLSHGLIIKRVICISGDLYFSDTGTSYGEPLSLVGTFGASSHYQPSGTLSKEPYLLWSVYISFGWFLPTWHRWPSLCSHLGQLLGWQWLQWPPHLSQLLCLLYPPLQLTLGWRGFHFWYWGVCQQWGFLPRMHLHPGPYLQGLPALPHSRCFLCSCHSGKERQPIRNQSSLMRVMWHLFWIN